MTYNVILGATLLGYGKDWLAQCQDNVTEWDIRSWCWRSGLLVLVGQHYESHYECALSQVDTHPDMTLDVART